jgi:hypothetical protein
MTVTMDVPRAVIVFAALVVIAGIAISWVLALLATGMTDDEPEDDVLDRVWRRDREDGPTEVPEAVQRLHRDFLARTGRKS